MRVFLEFGGPSVDIADGSNDRLTAILFHSALIVDSRGPLVPTCSSADILKFERKREREIERKRD